MKNFNPINADLGLTPYQSEFIESYFTYPEVKMHQLFAPPGSGASYAVNQIIKALCSKKHGARVLSLSGHKAGTLNVAHYLHKSQLQTTLVDRFKYRELKSKEGLWDQAGVYITTTNFAKLNDVSDIFLSIPWDLIVIDNPHTPSPQSHEFIQRLIDKEHNTSVILISNTFSPLRLNPNFLEAKTTKWHPGELISSQGIKLWHAESVNIDLIAYSPSDLEVHIQKVIDEILSILREHEPELPAPIKLVRESLVRVGLFEAELKLQSLSSKLRIFRNQFSHGMLDCVPATGQTMIAVEHAQELIDEFNQLVDNLESDNKADALVYYLKKHDKPNTRVVITTPSVANAEYLRTSIGEEFSAVKMLSSKDPIQTREEVISEHRDNGGILVVSEALLKGIDLPNTDILITYDLPRTVTATKILLSRFLRSDHLTIASLENTLQPSQSNVLSQALNAFQ